MPKSGDGYLVPEVVYAGDLLRKWNIDPTELNGFVESLALTPFLLHSKRENPDTGEAMYFIKVSRSGYSDVLPTDISGNVDVSRVVFIPDQIAKVEQKHKHLTLVPVSGQTQRQAELEEKLVSAYSDVKKWADKAASAFKRIAELEAHLAEASKRLESGAKPIDPRNRNTLLAIIAAALCPQGNLSPVEERGQAGTLKRRGEALGLIVSEKTVKKTLNEVAEFVRENREKAL